MDRTGEVPDRHLPQEQRLTRETAGATWMTPSGRS